jgi:hypothetical protein
VAGAQAIQIIVTVLLVATAAAVFVVAIGVFVALTLHKFGRVSRYQPGPHETAMYLIHEPISVEDGNATLAELNPAIDFERFGGKPVPRWPRSRRAKEPSPDEDVSDVGRGKLWPLVWGSRRPDVRF